MEIIDREWCNRMIFIWTTKKTHFDCRSSGHLNVVFRTHSDTVSLVWRRYSSVLLDFPVYSLARRPSPSVRSLVTRAASTSTLLPCATVPDASTLTWDFAPRARAAAAESKRWVFNRNGYRMERVAPNDNGDLCDTCSVSPTWLRVKLTAVKRTDWSEDRVRSAVPLNRYSWKFSL